MKRSERLHSIAVLGAAAVVCAACSSLFPPKPEETFRLTEVGGQPLPAAITRSKVVDGGTVELQAVRGYLKLYRNGRFDKERKTRAVWYGVPDTKLHPGGGSSGTYERGDTTLLIRFIDENGESVVFRYSIQDSGRVLRGIEGFGGALANLYTYRRD